ncbi:MAG: tetratricopeptide repeat protein [Candidatus Wildermuthbacteria bacterium]|nr:tetratricopeptide repeat protein [Candidatus Wildermuthbacteria bacterium]
MKKLVPGVLIGIVAALFAGGALGFSYWNTQKEISWIKNLEGRHPDGATFVANALEAREELRDKNEDNDFAAHLKMGVSMNLLLEKQKALEWYEKALEKDAGNILALNNTANIYDDLGQYDLAELTWLKLIVAYPDNPSFYRSLGYLYWYRLHKSWQDIEALFVKGLEATDNDPDLVNWLMAYFLETGNNEKFAEYANFFTPKGQR